MQQHCWRAKCPAVNTTSVKAAVVGNCKQPAPTNRTENTQKYTCPQVNKAGYENQHVLDKKTVYWI